MSQARTFPNDTASVREARRYVLEVLGAIAQPAADAIALMVSELATNAVRHTSSRFTVVADRTEEQIRVAITDDGSGSPVVRTPRPADTSGRGLQIVEELASEWGVVPSVDGTGKTVWFAVALHA